MTSAIPVQVLLPTELSSQLGAGHLRVRIYPVDREININIYTVEPRFTDTRLIRTPRYYGQFRWSRRKPHTFSLKLTRLIRTPINTDNGHFPCPE